MRKTIAFHQKGDDHMYDYYHHFAQEARFSVGSRAVSRPPNTYGHPRILLLLLLIKSFYLQYFMYRYIINGVSRIFALTTRLDP